MPAPINTLKAALARGELQRGLWLNLPGAVPAEMAGNAGFDWCLIDGEHGPWDPSGIRDQLIALAATPTPAVLRVPVAEDWIIKQALDLGAQTLLIPMVNSAQEAEAIVRACRYPPEGTRGMGAMAARVGGFGAISEYPATANDQICVLVQAESRAALDNLDAITAVEGVDGVFIGPADLGADMGYRDDLGNGELWTLIEDGIGTIRAGGKAAGILVSGAGMEARMRAAGVTFMGCGGDAGVLQAGLTALARPS
ncbi:HpcH/HpaI aldolase family protein [Jannaschia sp. CCS1]|uniref:HpcH/HpaI aldolase family protein n=1 Tax=Jannaschia sp. (strain CCS1) TaxID=290400 RepID=UPI000053B1C1|nr:HpcH/HpaI aldolase/citrate lyase family protein [Jannaschia sp. CCS1]ABD55083.1 2,4-dihydroxyhept-2-enedioate aldolase [Jannaschia sp. CCS1]